MVFGLGKKKIGLVLGGGGTRGFAHLGVIKALQEREIEFDYISGVSAGAIVGVLLADGKTPEEIFDFLKDKRIMDFSKIHIPVSGLLSFSGLQTHLEKQLSVEKLEELKTPFIVGATNLNRGVIEYFEEGSAGLTVLASSSIPLLFSPVKIGEHLYADGGIYDNLPISPLKDKVDKIIAVNVSPVQETVDLDNMIKIASRVFQLSVNASVYRTRETCDLYIEPEGLDQYDILDSSHGKEMFEKGYEYAKKLEIDI